MGDYLLSVGDNERAGVVVDEHDLSAIPILLRLNDFGNRFFGGGWPGMVGSLLPWNPRRMSL